MTKELSVSRKYLTNHSSTGLGIAAWRLATGRNSAAANGGKREEERAPDLRMEMEVEERACRRQPTSPRAVPLCDRARELLGFNSAIPEEQKE